MLTVADKESVKKFREDLTALGTVYINDAWVQRLTELIVASARLIALIPPWSACSCHNVRPVSS